jgi:uncharacterized protein
MSALDEQQEPQPWGRVTSLGLAIIAMLIGQMVALLVVNWAYGRSLAQLADLAQDGVGVSVIIIVSTPIQVGILMLMARQTRIKVADYLALKLPRRSEVIVGVLVMIGFIVIGNLVSWLLRQPIVTPFQFAIYRTASAAGWLPILWLAVVVVTPIGEEILFRGFLFRGWHRRPGDVWLVIAATSALWAMSHLQYDLFVIVQIFIVGLILGWFRWVSGSVLLTILLHALVNCEGMFETFLALHK